MAVGTRPRCTTEATRIYASTVLHTDLDGVISADSSKLESVHLGQYEPTSLLAWGSDVRLSTFCDLVDDAELERGVACNACSDAFEASGGTCTLPSSAQDTDARHNFCEALDTADACAPVPARRRPQLIQ